MTEIPPGVLIGGVITISIFVLTHAGATIWWMSKINTTLLFVQGSVADISKTMLRHQTSGYTKEEAAKDFAVRDKEMAAMWKRVDALNNNGGHTHG